jgi:hypothetical protein
MLPFGDAVCVGMCADFALWNPASMASGAKSAGRYAMSAGRYAAILVMDFDYICHGISGCHRAVTGLISILWLYVLQHYGCAGRLIVTLRCAGCVCVLSRKVPLQYAYVPLCELQQRC